MKKILTLILFCTIVLSTSAQDTKLALTGGYVFTNLKEFDTSTTGWRVNVILELVPMTSNFSHLINIGFVRTSGSALRGVGTNTEFRASHWPFYYGLKYSFGEGALKPYAKGTAGIHISGYKRTGPLGDALSTADFGFYGGLGAGLTWDLSDAVFLTLEYEWSYMSETWYGNGFMNSITAGIGF